MLLGFKLLSTTKLNISIRRGVTSRFGPSFESSDRGRTPRGLLRIHHNSTGQAQVHYWGGDSLIYIPYLMWGHLKMHIFSLQFSSNFLTNPVNTSLMVIKKTIRQAPTYFDHLYKVVSPYEMSPHEIENLKRLL